MSWRNKKKKIETKNEWKKKGIITRNVLFRQKWSNIRNIKCRTMRSRYSVYLSSWRTDKWKIKKKKKREKNALKCYLLCTQSNPVVCVYLDGPFEYGHITIELRWLPNAKHQTIFISFAVGEHLALVICNQVLLVLFLMLVWRQ